MRLPALPFVRASVTAGLSANQAYRDYRAANSEMGARGIRRQDFLRMYSQTVRLRGQAADALTAPKDAINGGLDPVPRNTELGRAGLGYWVTVHQRETGGSEPFVTPFLVKSDEPLTPRQAETTVLGWLEREPARYKRTTLGVTFTGVEQFVPTLAA